VISGVCTLKGKSPIYYTKTIQNVICLMCIQVMISYKAKYNVTGILILIFGVIMVGVLMRRGEKKEDDDEVLWLL